MRKVVSICTLMMACSASVSAAADLQFVAQQGSVKHVLDVSKLSADARGIPSFDYTYRQQGKGCSIFMSGKATAGFDDTSGKIELEVYNPQRRDGKASPQILAFHDGEKNFTVARKDTLKPTYMTFDTVLDELTRAKSCDKKADRIEILLKKPAS